MQTCQCPFSRLIWCPRGYVQLFGMFVCCRGGCPKGNGRDGYVEVFKVLGYLVLDVLVQGLCL